MPDSTRKRRASGTGEDSERGNGAQSPEDSERGNGVQSRERPLSWVGNRSESPRHAFCGGGGAAARAQHARAGARVCAQRRAREQGDRKTDRDVHGLRASRGPAETALGMILMNRRPKKGDIKGDIKPAPSRAGRSSEPAVLRQPPPPGAACPPRRSKGSWMGRQRGRGRGREGAGRGGAKEQAARERGSEGANPLGSGPGRDSLGQGIRSAWGALPLTRTIPLAQRSRGPGIASLAWGWSLAAWGHGARLASESPRDPRESESAALSPNGHGVSAVTATVTAGCEYRRRLLT